MPMYDYHCHLCQHDSLEFMRMCSAAEAEKVECPKCQYPMTRQVSRVHTDLQEFAKPIEMFSIGMEDLGEIRAFKQRCPDVECSDDPRNEMYGVPIAKHRKGKLQALQAAGFIETK